MQRLTRVAPKAISNAYRFEDIPVDGRIDRDEVWCARQDSNLRPLAPEANALSS